MNTPTPPENDDGNQQVWSLGELSRSLKTLIEGSFEYIRVRAEIGRVTRAASGHVYFDLKDGSAVLSAVCWKGMAAQLSARPEEGAEVVASGKLTTYQGQSRYQLVVSDLVLAGEGALLKQLEERRRKLEAEGLFREENKKPIPAIPLVIGVVTSPTGSVIRDILHRLRERYPVRVLVWPVLVQGKDAAGEIAAAIRGFDALYDKPRDDIDLPAPDTVIVARGGGSAEDLMAFNDEAVVRAIAGCRIPVISGVGHETDTTLADFAADLRAPTPTAAAERASPVAADIQSRISDYEQRLLSRCSATIENAAGHLRNLARALADPAMLMESKGQRLDHIAARFDGVVSGKLTRLEERLAALNPMTPSRKIESEAVLLDAAWEKTESLVFSRCRDFVRRVEHLGRNLEILSYKSTLKRGFAVVHDNDGIMTSAGANPAGGDVAVEFADGRRAAALGKKS